MIVTNSSQYAYDMASDFIMSRSKREINKFFKYGTTERALTYAYSLGFTINKED